MLKALQLLQMFFYYLLPMWVLIAHPVYVKTFRIRSISYNLNIVLWSRFLIRFFSLLNTENIFSLTIN